MSALPFRAVLRGAGAALPERIVTNDALSERVDTSDAWIRERTGIAERRIARDGERTRHLAVRAARAAIDDADADAARQDGHECPVAAAGTGRKQTADDSERFKPTD